ncbi:MAG: zinc-binding dehydrogenase [Myxococcota bacterium]
MSTSMEQSTMKYVAIHQFGEPQVLRVSRTQVPTPDAGQIRVKVRYAGLNFADIMQRRGLYPGMMGMPFTPGMEVVGTVDAVGRGVTGIAVGDRVVSRLHSGGYAEYAIADAQQAVLVPDTLGDREAAALGGTSALTAWALHEQLGEPDGRPVFISAAAGALGSILVPLCVARGWTVLAGVSSAEKANLVVSLGASHAIRYDQEGWQTELLARAGEPGLAYVFDSVGGDIYRGAHAALGSFGQLIFFGAASGDLVGLPPEQVFPAVIHCHTIRGFGLPGHLAQDPLAFERATHGLFTAHSEGVLSDLRTHVYPLADVAVAHESVEQRRSSGKILFEV